MVIDIEKDIVPRDLTTIDFFHALRSFFCFLFYLLIQLEPSKQQKVVIDNIEQV